MISAGISKELRREIYRRDGWRCALCDSTDGIQIHHVVPRGEGGSDFPENLITLCWRCHAIAHGMRMPDLWWTQDDVTQMATEYVSDYYADTGWYPYK